MTIKKQKQTQNTTNAPKHNWW